MPFTFLIFIVFTDFIPLKCKLYTLVNSSFGVITSNEYFFCFTAFCWIYSLSFLNYHKYLVLISNHIVYQTDFLVKYYDFALINNIHYLIHIYFQKTSLNIVNWKFHSHLQYSKMQKSRKVLTIDSQYSDGHLDYE